MYTLFRSPCLMEDAGRHLHIGTFNTREAMEGAVVAQLGYFSVGDFYYFHADQKKSDLEHLKALPKHTKFTEYAQGKAQHDF